MMVDELSAHIKGHSEEIREQLLAGTYRPQEVKQQLIPKSGGGMRELGIPTVLDRLIQQVLLQVLQSELDGSFSDHSYGFRPGRSAHGAVCAAQRYVQEGRRWVVDVDVEKFFDRVNHVSPLLANVLLDTVDKELEKRGHRFVRYADDCNVYVQSHRSGERVMCLLRKLFAELKLHVNESKSAVDLARRREILGYSFWTASGGVVKRRVGRKALYAMKDRVR